MSRSIVIIGAGECGTRAALALRQHGFDGRLTLVGGEAGEPYERPPLSKEPLGADETFRPQPIATNATLSGQDITYLPATRAVSIDRGGRFVALDAGGRVAFDQLLLATGAVPRRLTVAPPSGRCLYLRDFGEARAIRRRLLQASSLLVIGGGLIGLELAALARGAGLAVTVVEAMPRLLRRNVCADIAGILARAHADAGVVIRCDVSVVAFEDDRASVRATLSTGETLAADFAVVAIGVVPETGLAAAGGLAIDNGIRVDGRLRTSDPGILAAGDCCAITAGEGGAAVRCETWSNAHDQAHFVAAAMLGSDARYDAVPWFWSDQFDLTLRGAGRQDGVAASVSRHTRGAEMRFHLGADGRLLAASAIGQDDAAARDMLVSRRLIAAGATPAPEQLRDATFDLKALLRSGA
ncbi:MAG: FAD-dependent oxidoreductase [Rhizobiaceae bacterium]|nr:FAD-dependent oxidoreductase [Rhizobiaceae bacterium]